MPVVRSEISCFPKDLLTNTPVDVPGRRWFVAHTMARQEKSLARDLYRRQIPFYLPLQPRRLSYKGRRVLSHHPLFSSFVFLYADEQERHFCLATGRVASILQVDDQTTLCQDLLRIAAALANGTRLSPEEDPLLSSLGLMGKSAANRGQKSTKESAAICGI
jgi:hypothetical protein